MLQPMFGRLLSFNCALPQPVAAGLSGETEEKSFAPYYELLVHSVCSIHFTDFQLCFTSARSGGLKPKKTALRLNTSL